jgi:hypothetical protein
MSLYCTYNAVSIMQIDTPTVYMYVYTCTPYHADLAPLEAFLEPLERLFALRAIFRPAIARPDELVWRIQVDIVSNG